MVKEFVEEFPVNGQHYHRAICSSL